MEHWKKFKKLGQGSFGTVYWACSTSSFAAVKTTGREHSSSLENEAAILKDLIGNPYVVQCYGYDVSIEGEQSVYNLLMEYAPGGTLEELIRGYGRTMPESLVAYYSYMLLRGVSGIHRKDLVHCDIKPSNVLVFENWNGSNHLKLADFGLAKYEWEEETTRIWTGLRYASPESIKHGVHRKATDIWSFGCTVLEMMLGGKTIRSDSVCTQDLLDAIVQQGPPEIPEYVSEVGRDFLMRCFEMNADSRWSADMLLDHPFIRENTNATFESANLVQMKNPFGSWIRTSGLFSSSAAPVQEHQQISGVGAAAEVEDDDAEGSSRRWSREIAEHLCRDLVSGSYVFCFSETLGRF